mgnify:CR=1 FL=1
MIISGKDKGNSGKVLRVYPKDKLILVEGYNLRKRHRKPRKAGEKGSIIQFPMPMAASKVMPKCPSCGKATRIGTAKDTNKRFCKKCKSEF